MVVMVDTDDDDDDEVDDGDEDARVLVVAVVAAVALLHSRIISASEANARPRTARPPMPRQTSLNWGRAPSPRHAGRRPAAPARRCHCL